MNEHYQTAVPHIYAVGDVIGFPALASTSMEQGRLARRATRSASATTSVPELFPVRHLRDPRDRVGRRSTERELTEQGVPFETGVARYKEIARGQILGDEDGMLKLIFHLETRQHARACGCWAPRPPSWCTSARR